MSHDLEQLYPFLGEPAARGDDDLIASTEAKIDEAAQLRRHCLEHYHAALTGCAAAIAQRLADGGRIFSFGNGGSSTDAAALAAAFTRCSRSRPTTATALCDVETITALANDVSFDVVFARQLDTLARPSDVVVALSTSGNSTNVIRALAQARERRALTVGFAGNDGGQMASEGCLDHLFVVPSASVHRIQEAQTTLYHVLAELTAQAWANR
jgi:D-sedoheptulose 7-phosphate isomerase